MKIAIGLLMVMVVMACGFSYAGQGTHIQSPSARAIPVSTPTMRVDIISLTPSKNTIITASEGVRLRDRPDAAGPVDSVEIDIMHSGDTFLVESCQMVNGDWWAFGMFGTKKGWALSDFLSPNPCGGK